MTDNPLHPVQKAYFGGGCFWCTEAIFERVRGVTQVISGYAGGTHPHPNYFKVSEELTGHAEVVEISFDPQQIKYQQLLDIFFHTHNPTTKNKQGNDEGTHYRSIILYANDEQKILAETALKAYQNDWSDPIVTEVQPLDTFHPAEEYHQEYYERNRQEQYCQLVIEPKLDHFQKRYQALLKRPV